MNKFLLIGICLVVATLGFNIASAADPYNTTISDVMDEERNVEYIGQNKIESVNQVVSSNPKDVENNGIFLNFGKGNPGPAHNKDPNPFNNKRYDFPIILGGGIDMRNESNHTHNNDENKPIAGVTNESNIYKSNASTDPDFKIIDKTETFDYKGEECFLALVDTGKGQKLVCYKASSTGMNAAGSSYVGEVGSEIVQILEEKGIIAKWAYDCSMRHIKKLGIFQKIFKEVFDYDFLSCINDDSKEYYIIYVAFGETKANEYLKSNSNN